MLLQAYTEEAENLLYHARRCTPNLNNHEISIDRQARSLYQKLAEIQKEELRSMFSLADPSIEQNCITLTDSRLIEKLVRRERLNTLIFNLYPANRGYTLSVIVRGKDDKEKTLTSMRLPYTEEQLFSYIDNEEIPPLLCDVIDNCVVQLYYNGCIVAEIRDYRKSSTSAHYVKHHVLLHQSIQTIVNDVNEAICSDKNIKDELSSKLEMEKTLLLANYGPLCLNPRPSIAIANQKLHYSKYFLNTHKLRFKARRHTLLGIAQRKRQEMHSRCAPSITGLVDFIFKKKASQETKTKVPKKHLPECPVSNNFWTEAARSVLELAKPLERPLDMKELIFSSKVIEEYCIETKDDAGLQFMNKLTISQRYADYEYIGETLQSRELNTGGFHNISYSFPLGTRELATRYILEFTNVYTERGKIRVNFSHKVPGKPPEVCVTSGLRMEGNKLVPIEAKSLGLDTLVPLEKLSCSKNDAKMKNVLNVSKIHSTANSVSYNVPQFTSLLKKANTSSSAPTQKLATVIPQSTNVNLQHRTANNDISESNASNVTPVNGNTSTILSLLANTSAQSSPSSTANITLSNLLSSSTVARSISSAQTVNVSGPRVFAKRVKMQGATHVIAANQQIATSLANAAVIAASANSVSNVSTQPVIRLSLSSLQNQNTPVIQQRGGKNIASRIIAPGSLKTASIQPVTVTSTGSLQIGNNGGHSLSAVQSLLSGAAITQNASGLRMNSTNTRRNVVVGGIQSLTVNTSNGQTSAETQSMNCAKLQNNIQSGLSQMSAGELQTITGTLTAAPTISNFQLARSVQTVPAASVHLVSSSNSVPIVSIAKTRTTLNNIQVNTAAPTVTTTDGMLTKGQKIMRLSNNQEAISQNNIGLPMSTLSALLSGTPVTERTSTSSVKNSNLVERINSPMAVSTGHATTTTSPNASYNFNSVAAGNLGMQNLQNVQVSIPGMAVPITLSVNVGNEGTVSYLDTSSSQNVQVCTTLSNMMNPSTVILSNSNTGNNMKTLNLRPVTSSAAIPNVPTRTVQQLQLIGAVQRSKVNPQFSKPLAARSLLNTNRVRLVTPPSNAVVQQLAGNQGQELSVTAQQQLQLALQKQAAQLQLHQGLTAAGGLKITQKRRRSSVTTDGS